MRYYALVLALFVSILGWSQELNFVFKGTVENLDVGNSEGGVTVKIVQNGASLYTTSTASNGKYKLEGMVNYKTPFDVVFSKSGLVSKKVHFNLADMNEEDVPPGDIRPVEALDMTMFKDRDNVDFSFLNTQPVASFDWNTRGMSIRLDQVGSNDIRVKIQKLLQDADKEKMETDRKYQEAIVAADAAYNKQEYEKALGKYEEASGLKPKEQYPIDRILELDALIQAQKKEQLAQEQADSEYNNLIAAADNLRDQDKLEDAIKKYEEAITKKDEQYPKDQIDLLKQTVEDRAAQAELDAKYNAAIKSADGFFKQKSYQAARDNYQKASDLKPGEQYPKDKLAEIEKMLEEQAAVEETQKKYEAAIAEGDKLFDAEDFAGAKAKYEEALTYEASSTYAKGRIAICDEKLAAQKEEEERLAKIQALMDEGLINMSNSAWEAAKGNFEEVLTLDTEHAEAKAKLAEVEAKIKEAGDLAAQQEKYNKLVQEGDAADASNDLPTALSKYQEAKTIMSTPEVEAKIADVQKRISELEAEAEKENEYAKHMSEGESLMGIIGDIEGARAEFEKALAVFPDRQEPKDKIAQIDELLAAQNDAKEKKAAYDAAIASADQFFSEGKYEDAKSKYNEALTIDNAQSYPSERISEIDGLLANQAEEAERKANYDAAIEAADHMFNEAKWEEAKAKYREALTFDNNATYPNERIAEIDLKIEEQNAEEALTAKINALLKEGSDKYSSGDLEAAKLKYEEVLGLEASHVEATEQLKKINSELAAMKNEAERDALFNQLKEEGYTLADNEQFEEAKRKLEEALAVKGDTEVQNKLEEIIKTINDRAAQADLDARYIELISKAQGQESSNDYQNAVNTYKEALSVKPNEQLPKDRISELEALLNNEAAQKEIDDKYNALITDAEGLEASNKLQDAIGKYEEASAVKPAEQYPKDKIEALQNQLANSEKQEEIDRQYRVLIDQGDELVRQGKYLDAIQSYNEALALKPGEQEPVDKANKAEELARNLSEADQQYEKIITTAQKKLDEENYDRAIELLERAIKLKDDDERPKTMLETAKLLQKEKNEYDALMASGDQLASNGKYEEAKNKYLEASRKRPSETLPPEKIAEMDRILADLASEEQKLALYKEYMSMGDISLNAEDYEKALMMYQNALSAKPGDVPAQDKINEVQQIMDNLANAKQAEIDRKNKYDALVNDADALFGNEEYLTAKGKYEEAQKLIATDYVKTQIDECVRLEKLKGITEAEKEYRKIIAAADKNFGIANYEKAKDYYQRAVNVKRDDPYPKEKLKEIDAILNPTIISSAELEDLGDIYNGTMEEALSELQKAEEERKVRNGVQADAAFSGIQDGVSLESKEQYQQHYENSQDIYLAYERISLDAGESDLNREERVERIRQAERELAADQRLNSNYEYAENISDQDLLYKVNEDVALDYGERDKVYQDNSAKMKEYNTALRDEMSEDNLQNYDKNLVADEFMDQVRIEMSKSNQDDFDERDKVRQDVQETVRYASDEASEMYNDRYDVALLNEGVVEKVKTDVSNKAVEDAEIAKDNNEELVKVRNNIVDEDYNHALDKNEHLQKTDAEMSETKRRISADNQDLDNNRLESNEVLKQSKKELKDAEMNKYNSEMGKYVKNKAVIEEEVAINEEIKVKENEAHALKVEYVDMMDKKAHVATVDGMEGDEEERLRAKKEIEKVYYGVEANSQEEREKLEDNTTELNDKVKTIRSQESANMIGEQEKHYENAANIAKVDNTPKEKPKIANTLGSEYPEGVSQESFTRSDQSGLMTAIVTRRIVVIDGHADVYVRTQTSSAITYSKNGKPTTAHVWSKETQDPKLERHY